MTYICISNVTIIGSDNGLSPTRRHAIIWTNAGIVFIGPLGTDFGEFKIKIHIFLLIKMHLKMLSAKWWPFCLSLNVLNQCQLFVYWCPATNIDEICIKIHLRYLKFRKWLWILYTRYPHLTHKWAHLCLTRKARLICMSFINSSLPGHNGCHFGRLHFQMHFSMKNFEFLLKFHWSLFLRVQLTITHHWFR